MFILLVELLCGRAFKDDQALCLLEWTFLEITYTVFYAFCQICRDSCCHNMSSHIAIPLRLNLGDWERPLHCNLRKHMQKDKATILICQVSYSIWLRVKGTKFKTHVMDRFIKKKKKEFQCTCCPVKNIFPGVLSIHVSSYGHCALNSPGHYMNFFLGQMATAASGEWNPCGSTVPKPAMLQMTMKALDRKK